MPISSNLMRRFLVNLLENGYRFMNISPYRCLKQSCKVLLLIFSLFLILSCSSNPNDNEFDDNQNDNMEEIVPYVPVINTSEEFVLFYNSYSNKSLTGPEAIVADMESFLWETYWKCRAIQAYHTDLDNFSYKYNYQLYFPGRNYRCDYYEYSFNGYTAEVGNQSIQVWGTANYSEKVEDKPVEGTINEFTTVWTDWFDCDLVIKINDEIFSFKSDYLDTTNSLFKGTVTINKVDYQLNFSV